MNGEQLEFPDAPAPGLAMNEHPDTAHAAALEVTPRTGTQRRRILDYLATLEPGAGATDAEIQSALAMNGNTERPRRIELTGAGWLGDSGRTRAVGGRAAIVWVLLHRPGESAPEVEPLEPEPDPDLDRDGGAEWLEPLPLEVAGVGRDPARFTR